MSLPKPRVERCYFERSIESPLPAMQLCWDVDSSDRTWHLPDGMLLNSPVPRRFGITIHRLGDDSYQVRVLWDRLYLCWESLTRVQIMASSLAVILNALGTDLWYLLNQSIEMTDVALAA